MKNQGGLSTYFAQLAASYQKDIHGKVGVYVEREATFTEDMKSIESRHFLAIVVVDMDGYQTENELLRVSRQEARRLRDALDRALEMSAHDAVKSPYDEED